MPDGSGAKRGPIVATPWVGSETLTGRLWRFDVLGGQTFVPFMVLAPDGRTGNYAQPKEDERQLVDGDLEFVTRAGNVSTRFDCAILENGTIEMLAGRVRLAGCDHFHRLDRVEHPAIRERDEAGERRATLCRGSRRRRPNLMVPRARETSLAWRLGPRHQRS